MKREGGDVKGQGTNQKITGIKNLKKIKPYLKQYKLSILGMLFFDVLSLVFNVINPLLLSQVLLYFTDFNLKNILYYLLLFFISLSMEYVFDYFSNLCSYLWVRHSAKDLQNKVISQYLNIKSSKLDKLNSGIITTRFTNDCSKIAFSLYRVFFSLNRAVAGIAYIVIAFFLNVYLALFLLCSAIITFLCIRYVSGKRAKFDYEKDKKMDVIVGIENETMRGWKDVKSLGLKSSLGERIMRLNEEYSNYTIKQNKKIGGIQTGTFIIKNIVFVGFYVLCGWFMLSGWITLPLFLVFYMYHGRIDNALNLWGTVRDEITIAEVAAKRVFELLDEEEYPLENFGEKSYNGKGKIKFSNVTFSYNGEYDVLKDVSFEIKPNTMVAIVGESGIGKSTILGLISKFYEPQKGEIYFDKININDIKEEDLRKTVGLVLQTPYVFNLSIKENLKLAKPDATNEEIEEVCRKAQLQDFILGLNDKYDSVVGENGVILSGGQRQRLAIARALLKNNKILLFDEATSALDNKSQQKIKEVLFNLKKDHTIVIVAHRISTVIDADNIILFSNGKIKAEGKHKQLLKTCKEYQELYNVES